MMSATVSIAIDRELRMFAQGAGEPLRAGVEYALAGGKGTRGLLLVAMGSDEALSETAPLVRAAACLELLHAATLVQDDIFDRSRVRRGRPATYLRFGLPAATLVSDWMLTEAIRTAYRLHPDYGDALSRCAQGMMTGAARELMPTVSRTGTALREHALAIARAKTGEMFGLALCGAALLRGELPMAGELHGRGVALGLAFQYMDDVLDLHGDPASTGKEVGCDLRSGLLTLPVLDALPLLPTVLADSLLASDGPLPASSASALQAEAVQRYLEERVRRQWEEALAGLRDTLAPDGVATGGHSARVLDVLRCLAETMLPKAEMGAAA